MVNRRPRLRVVAPAASPEEAAAVVAALERFMRDTALKAHPVQPGSGAWARAAIREATGHDVDGRPIAWGPQSS